MTLFSCLSRTDRERLAECKSLTRAQIGEYAHLVDLAASQGSEGAQLAYLPMMATFMQSDERTMMDEEAIRSFKYKSLSYLHRAASHGSVDALNQLAIVYNEGYITRRDPVAAYAYMYATYRSGLVPGSSKVLALWGQQLSARDVSSGASKGEAIYRSCCVGD